MKKFQYRLQALLKIREHIESQRQKELAQAMTQLQRQQDSLDQIESTREHSTDYHRQRLNQRFTVADMLVFSRYVQKLRKERVLGEQMRDALQKNSDDKRERLVAAARERRKYERLRERLHEKHLKEAEMTMSKDNDEIAITSHRQKKLRV